MKNIKSFTDFYSVLAVEEGKEVAVLNMVDVAQNHIDEIKNAFNAATSELYDLKKMADDIMLEYPDISKHMIGLVEPMMETLEHDFPQKLKSIIKKMSYDHTIY